MNENKNIMKQTGFKIAERHGNGIYGALPLGFMARISRVVTANTVFEVEILSEIGYTVGARALTNFLVGWYVVGRKTSNNDGGITPITAVNMTTSPGRITVTTLGAAWVVGDIIELAPPYLLGYGQGEEFVIHKASTITPTTAGVDLTGVASGAIWVKDIAVQKITANEANAVTSLLLISNDTVPLNHIVIAGNGNIVRQAGVANDHLQSGQRYANRVDWLLASGKKLQVKTTGANGTAGYLWTILCARGAHGATLASA